MKTSYRPLAEQLRGKIPPILQHLSTGITQLTEGDGTVSAPQCHRPSQNRLRRPPARWLRHELRPLVDDVLSAASIRRRGLFDADGVARLVQADREGRIDAAYTIFAVVCIEVWCRMFIDGIPSKSPSIPLL